MAAKNYEHEGIEFEKKKSHSLYKVNECIDFSKTDEKDALLLQMNKTEIEVLIKHYEKNSVASVDTGDFEEIQEFKQEYSSSVDELTNELNDLNL